MRETSHPKYLQIRLLGKMEAQWGEAPLAFRSEKIKALFAYLVMQPGRPLHRSQLAAMLWEEQSETSARYNLRLSLSRLRQTLSPLFADGIPEDSFLSVQRHTIEWHPPPSFCLTDMQSIQEVWQACQWHSHAEISRCFHCHQMFQRVFSQARLDPFLEDLSLPSCPTFQSWRLQQQKQMSHTLQGIQSIQEQHQKLILPYQPLDVESSIWHALTARLVDPSYRLLSLVGPPSTRRTQLAAQAALALAPAFSDGVWRIPMDNAQSTPASPLPLPLLHYLSPLLATPLHGTQAAPHTNLSHYTLANLCDAIVNKELLVLLDAYEVNPPNRQLLLDMLERLPSLVLLVTSTRALHLHQESVVLLS